MAYLQRMTDLAAWTKRIYSGKKIPVSGEPYFEHVRSVAESANEYAVLAYEVGLCHDMLEDQIVTEEELENILQKLGYDKHEVYTIVQAVKQLSDVYTKTSFPEMNKKERKRKEEDRLAGISELAQTVKYADLIYNVGWVTKYQRKKVRKYLRRKIRLLKKLNMGDASLRRHALKIARWALESY